MSCQEKDKRQALLDHLRSHTQQICESCHEPLQCNEGELPFGNDIMTTWVCPKCAREKVVVIREDGKILEA